MLGRKALEPGEGGEGSGEQEGAGNSSLEEEPMGQFSGKAECPADVEVGVRRRREVDGNVLRRTSIRS